MQSQIAAIVAGVHIEELRREAAVGRVARRARRESRRSRTSLASFEASISARRAAQRGPAGEATPSPAPR